MMNPTDTHRFDDIYKKYELGEQEEGLRRLRDLASTLSDPWDKAELLYHEVLFLVDMGRVAESRDRLNDLKAALAGLTQSPPDTREIDVAVSLYVMTRYSEIRVAIAEGKHSKALQLIDNLLSRYPKQLTSPSFADIMDDINTNRGFLLAEAGQWAEARPFLECARPPKSWRGALCYYLGYCHYECVENTLAKAELTEALTYKLTKNQEARAHYILGIIECHLLNKVAAKKQFELCAQIAEPEDLVRSKVWEWLEATSKDLGLYEEANSYRQRRRDLPTDSHLN